MIIGHEAEQVTSEPKKFLHEGVKVVPDAYIISHKL